MSGFKVVMLVSTRPALIELSLTIAEIDRRVDHVLVHTGQNYELELNEVCSCNLDIRKPEHFPNAAGSTKL